MSKTLKYPCWGRNFLIIPIIVGVLLSFLPIFGPMQILMPKTSISKSEFQSIEAESEIKEISEDSKEQLVIIQGNSLLPISSPSNPKPQPARKILVIVTAYSSTVDQTDLDPFITAAGTQVREGIVANNFLPLGTKIQFPEIYGDKVFVVEDRMHWTKGNDHIDIWFSDYRQALNFGTKRTYIEILEG